jgi:hypothetical protein
MRSLDVLHSLPDGALCTPLEASTILLIEPRLMAEWRTHGRGPAFVKVGHLVRYQMGALRAYIGRGQRKVIRR